jgi:peroxiredoxin
MSPIYQQRPQKNSAFFLHLPPRRNLNAYFELADINGERLRLSDLREQVVVLGFGFHCGFCQIKLPYFQAASHSYKENGGACFLWIADHSASVPELREYMEQNGFGFRMFRDTGEYLDKQGVHWLYGVDAMPQVFVLDKQGRIRYREIGGVSYDSDCEIDYSEALGWKIEALLAS